MRALRAACLTAVLVSCAEGDAPVKAPPAHASAESKVATSPEVCTLSTAAEGHILTWTAFKFTERVGVEGGFDAITVSAGKPGDAAWKAIDGMKPDRHRLGQHRNAERDAKIRKYFFGSSADFGRITGRIKANSPGKATLFVEMNGQQHSVVVDVSAGSDSVRLNGMIDVEQWGAGLVIAALNEVCAAVHTDKTACASCGRRWRWRPPFQSNEPVADPLRDGRYCVCWPSLRAPFQAPGCPGTIRHGARHGDVGARVGGPAGIRANFGLGTVACAGATRRWSARGAGARIPIARGGDAAPLRFLRYLGYDARTWGVVNRGKVQEDVLGMIPVLEQWTAERGHRRPWWAGALAA